MMRKLSYIPVGFLLAATCLSFCPRPEARACPGSNSADLTGPTSVTWVSGSVEFDLEASWATTGTPFIGVTQGLELVGVTNVVYDPAYFFPASCEDSITVTVTADKATPDLGQYAINTKLNVGPSPYDEDDVWVVSISN